MRLGGLLLALVALAPGALALVPLPANAPVLLNGDFTVQPAYSEGKPEEVREAVIPVVGSAAPGTTDSHTRPVALGWNYRSYSGQTEPSGWAYWLPEGAVRVRVDPRDVASATAVLTQAIGQRDHACVYEGVLVARVGVHDVAGAAELRAHVFDPRRPHEIQSTAPVSVVEGARPRIVTLPFTGMPDLCGAEFLLSLRTAAGATMTLDWVDLDVRELGAVVVTE